MKTNSTKVWIFILVSSLILLILGYELGERMGLFIGFLLAVSLNFFVFFYGESRLLSSYNAQLLKGQDAWGLNELVEKYSDQLGIPQPHLYLIPSETETALCVQHSWRHGAIALTSGLVKNFSKEDLEAVIAYQVSSLKKMDGFAVEVTSTLANAVMGVGRLLDLLWPPNYFLLGPKKQHPFTRLVSPLAWVFIKMASRHHRYFENDLLAAELIHDRFRLAEVLWRLEGLAQTQPLSPPPCSSHLFIVNPEGYRQKFFFKSHPSIERRLQKLMGYYPI